MEAIEASLVAFDRHVLHDSAELEPPSGGTATPLANPLSIADMCAALAEAHTPELSDVANR
jgi:hypothetical protein